MPRISVIIPVLNEARRIDACLSALRAQIPSVAEIIVVDGGSSDDTLKRVAGRADSVLTTAPGRAMQMNAGAAVARCDILWFLHADTVAPPGATAAIAQAGERGAAWGRCRVRLSSNRAVFRCIETAINWRSRLSGIATGDQGIFVRRERFREVRGFPEIALMEDIALSRKLRRQSRPACLKVRLTTSSRRWEAYGIARTVWMMWRLRFGYWRGVDPEYLAKRYAADS